MIADEVAKSLGFIRTIADAEWTRLGMPAGPIRNREMAAMGPCLVIAFHENIQKSKGTKDMIEAAKERGIPYEIIT